MPIRQPHTHTHTCQCVSSEGWGWCQQPGEKMSTHRRKNRTLWPEFIILHQRECFLRDSELLVLNGEMQRERQSDDIIKHSDSRPTVFNGLKPPGLIDLFLNCCVISVTALSELSTACLFFYSFTLFLLNIQMQTRSLFVDAMFTACSAGCTEDSSSSKLLEIPAELVIL